MTTSHLIGKNFASDVSKNFEADADDTIVIDKLLLNKLTELLINSIYSVHVSRRSEFFLVVLFCKGRRKIVQSIDNRDRGIIE